jgi:RHS repeat-associated protein
MTDFTICGTSVCFSRSHFTGKERDQESGNDYFGARYYASTMGRWMSPDPSNLGVDIYMPQTWNRYNYAVNNPLTIKDANGLWPFYIHNEIINESFPGMSKQDLQGLKSASWNMDFGKGQQDPSMSYEHGMSDGTTNQDPMVAQQMGDDFISQQVQTAQQAQADWEAQGHTGIAPAALTAFGNALHTATDRTSPSHRGNQPWKNEPWYKKSTRDHVAGEATINANDRRAAQNAAQQLFHRTFGDEFDWMLQKQPCAQTSATDSQGNTTGWSPCQ